MIEGVAESRDRLGSFPSDTATLYFSLVTIVFLKRPLLGSIALLWSWVTVGLVRVAPGWHYPIDIVGGARTRIRLSHHKD